MKCAVEVCDRDAIARGWCISHYRYWERGVPVPNRKIGERRQYDHEALFWSKVAIGEATDCWPWVGAINPSTGYGRLTRNRKGQQAHRCAFEYTKGQIPVGLELDHLCRNRACVNPSHLQAVTPRENFIRGESPIAIAARSPLCKNGHPFDSFILRSDGRRHRLCLTCHNARLSARRRAS